MQHNSFLWLLVLLIIYFMGLCLFWQLKHAALRYLFYTNVGLNPDANTLWHSIKPTNNISYSNNSKKLSWLGVFEAFVAVFYSLCLVFVYISNGFIWHTHFISIFFTLLLFLALIDRYTFLLPNALIVPLAFIGVLNAMFFIENSLNHIVLGFLSGYIFLYVLNLVFYLIYKKQAFGYGDIKLLAAIGIWLGAASIPLVMCIASITNSVFAVLQQRSLKPKGYYPFGPFIAIGAIVTLIYTKYVLI